jgi:hypothetical protein
LGCALQDHRNPPGAVELCGGADPGRPRRPENLYVTDATLIPRALGGSPILTIVALVRRVGRRCIEVWSGARSGARGHMTRPSCRLGAMRAMRHTPPVLVG